MLTVEEAKLALRVIKICSIFCIFPIGVDVKSGKIGRQSSKKKVFIWKILFGIGILHWLYMFGRLIQSTVIEPEKYFRWDHFVFHFGLTFAAAVFDLTGFYLFLKNAEENEMIFNQLFVQPEDPVQKIVERLLEIQRENTSGSKNGQGQGGNKTGGKSGATAGTRLASAREQNESDQNQNQIPKEVTPYKSDSEIHHPRPLLTWPPQYSLDELLAKLVLLFAVFTAFFIVLILAIDPTRHQLLFSCLPPEWQNMWSFLPLLAVEGLCMTISCLAGNFTIATQVLFFGKVHLELGRISLQLRNFQEKIQNGIGIGGRDVRREIWILRQILKEMKELVVFIELFNRCFPFCIFAWKILSLANCILFYFFVIRHSDKFPFLAVFVGYCAVIMTLFYTIMYEHAFSIPGKMEELKNEFLLTAQKTTTTSNADSNANKNVQAEMRREIKRIREVGIKVGSFHQMERESTPAFIDFVFAQVVDLLVTFPR